MKTGIEVFAGIAVLAASASPVSATALDFGASNKPSPLTASAVKSGVDGLGLRLRSLNPAERRLFGVPDGGLLVAGVGEGAARRAGFLQGDVLLMVDGVQITGMTQFHELERRLPHDRPVPALVRRPQGTLFLPLYPAR